MPGLWAVDRTYIAAFRLPILRRRGALPVDLRGSQRDVSDIIELQGSLAEMTADIKRAMGNGEKLAYIPVGVSYEPLGWIWCHTKVHHGPRCLAAVEEICEAST